jgi:hypothetical protein
MPRSSKSRAAVTAPSGRASLRGAVSERMEDDGVAWGGSGFTLQEPEPEPRGASGVHDARWMCVEPGMAWEKVQIYSAEQIAKPGAQDKPFTVYKMAVRRPQTSLPPLQT